MADKRFPPADRWLVPVTVVLVHLVLAFLSASPAIHTGGDNAAYISLANSLASEGSYVESWHPGAPPHTKYPPLYPTVLALMMLLGAKTWGAFKVASMLFTGLAVAACFLMVRKARGPRAAVAVSALFAVAPAVLFSAQWILADPLFMVLTLACLWLLTPDPDVSTRSLALGLVAATAAYFTRSAGLPLLVAVVVWLTLQRRWRPLAVFAGLFAVPGLLWQLRAGADYVSEFWLVNPYAPDLGRAGPVELVGRVAENLWTYTTDYVPAGLTGLDGLPAGVVGVLLAALALAGWVRRIRAGPQVGEIFCFLYVGLIVAWPEAWSGDRFALPILPLLLLYAGESAALMFRRWRVRPAEAAWLPWLGRAAVVAAAAVFLVPAGKKWYQRAERAGQCRAVLETVGPMGCYLRVVAEFHAMALWAGRNLPEGSVVLSRKPRLFHVFSGLPSVTYPFTTDGRSLLTEADSMDVGYLVRGNWDTTGRLYVDPVLSASPDRFCVVAQLGYDRESPVSMLAIVPPVSDVVTIPDETAAAVLPCPDAVDHVLPSAAEIASMTVPILDR
ncbi:MAG: hypothetical protein OXU74_01460 [Gemmatimonadota bacterium]|nr:hypothetical protein [Gemmatimonadota bacterium]